MAKNKDQKEEMQAAEAAVEAPKEASDFEALKAKLEQEAMDKVLLMLKINKGELEELARIKSQAEEMVDYNIGNIDVYINGNVVPASGRVTRAEAEVILSLAANKRHRYMSEVFGKKGMANLENGVIRAEIKVTEVTDLSGQQVSQ